MLPRSSASLLQIFWQKLMPKISFTCCRQVLPFFSNLKKKTTFVYFREHFQQYFLKYVVIFFSFASTCRKIAERNFRLNLILTAARSLYCGRTSVENSSRIKNKSIWLASHLCSALHFVSEAQFLVPASHCSLACRYDIPTP